MRKALLAGTAIACAIPFTALAQTQAGASAASDGALAEIIVTAQRREENLQRAANRVRPVCPDWLRYNVEDELVFANLFQSPVKTGVVYNNLRPPRTYGIRATARF